MRDGVLVAVTDFHDSLPVVKEPTEDQTCGRGLFLLSQLADELEVHPLARGKEVRFRLNLAQAGTVDEAGAEAP
jgi:hypothetical protein